MNITAILIFAAVAAVALGFVCRPLWRSARSGRLVLVAAMSALMLGIALGSYLELGRPDLAGRSFRNPRSDDLRALVSALAVKVREHPQDPRGWFLLGRGYLGLNDPVDASLAFKRAVYYAPPAARPALLSAYAEAATLAAGGAVTTEAEAAFDQVLAADPKDPAARFYVGQAYAERHDAPHALQLWESLLADTPPQAPWRGPLLDRIAMLKGATGGPPNIAAMVQRLAERLKLFPNDPPGWQRLVRAYAVLGEDDKARAALATARRALAGNSAVLTALADEARMLKLEK
jgi:cytochrome c-type biogenesis protein CcmH